MLSESRVVARNEGVSIRVRVPPIRATPRDNSAVMDGDIFSPGDLHGRVIQAGWIVLAWDGYLISALVGQDLVVGVSGFGDEVPSALIDLADNLIREAVWVEVADPERIDLTLIHPAAGCTIETNVIALHRTEQDHACVLATEEGSSTCVFAIADSVHAALRALAAELVSSGVWITVTARREWRFR